MDDRPSVTETDRGGVYERDRQTNRQKKKEMPLKFIKFYKIFLQVLECVITFDLFQWNFHVFCTFPSIRFRGTSSFCFGGTWSVHPFHRHFLYEITLSRTLTASCYSYFFVVCSGLYMS